MILYSKITIEPFITKGKSYDAELTPTIYDPETFIGYKDYIIKCDDGKSRKVNTSVKGGLQIDYFYDLQQMREDKLNQILL